MKLVVFGRLCLTMVLVSEVNNAREEKSPNSELQWCSLSMQQGAKRHLLSYGSQRGPAVSKALIRIVYQ